MFNYKCVLTWYALFPGGAGPASCGQTQWALLALELSLVLLVSAKVTKKLCY